MSLPSTSSRGYNAPAPVVVGHLVAIAGYRARVLPARPLRTLQQRQRTVVQAVTQEDEVALSRNRYYSFEALKNATEHTAFPTRQSPLALPVQEVVDLDQSVDATKRKLIDAAGAGKSFTSPGWLTQLGRLWGGKSVCHVC